MEHAPKRVAVLPFVITYAYDLPEGETIPASHRDARNMFRNTFYHALSPHGFEDVKLADVDARLAARWGPVEAGGWQSATPQELGEALGADGLVYGEIHRLVHVSSPMYTDTSLEATLRLVDAASGGDLWRQRVSASERGGVLLQRGQVVDLLKDQVRSFNPAIKFLRVSDAAVGRALKTLPNPPMAAGAPAQPDQAAASGQRAPRLAILPFAAQRSRMRAGASALRRDVAANLLEGPFEVLELQRIDAALAALGWQHGDPVPEGLAAADLGETLGADLLLHGTVTRWGRTFLLLQSWVTAQLQLELVDAASGISIWSDKRKNSRTSGVLKGVTGYGSVATSAVKGLKQSHLERVGTHLAREMAQELAQAPGVLTYLHDDSVAEQP